MEEKQKPEDNNNIVEPKENGEIQTVEELQTRDGQVIIENSPKSEKNN